jgi:hypothetical protein
MIIQIAERMLQESRWFPLLDALVEILQQPQNRHSFDLAQIGTLSKSAWLAGASGARLSTAEFIKSSVRSVAKVGLSDAVTLRIDDQAPSSGETIDPAVIRIGPYSALTILMQPLHLIVEDESSDGAFVLWMARLLGRETIREAYNAGRLLFRHAGGKGQICKSARALTYGVWPREGKPILSLKLRAVVLLDSDGRFPEDCPNSQYVKEAEPFVAFVQVLKGRTIENYVPKKFATRWLIDNQLGSAADPYFRMTDEQRNHFPIKKGFKDEASPPTVQTHASFLADRRLDLRERDLYRSANAVDWEQFAAGFGIHLGSVFQEPQYRCEPDSHFVIGLRGDHRDEINAFLSEVIRYL